MRLKWVLIFISSTSMAGNKMLAYDLNVAGVPVLDAVAITFVATLVISGLRSGDLAQIFHTRRNRLIIALWTAVGLISLFESEFNPSEHLLRLLLPFAFFGLALLDIPNAPKWTRNQLRWLLGLPILLHFAFNLGYLWSSGNQLDSLERARTILAPDFARADGLGLMYGFALLALADWFLERGRFSRPRLIAVAFGVAYLGIAGQVAHDHKALVLGQGLCAIALLLWGHRYKSSRSQAFGAYSLAFLALGFFAAPTLSTWQPATTTPATTTPATTTPATTTPADSRLRIEGSEMARLDTWGDIIQSSSSFERLIFGGNSADKYLLLKACGFTSQQYQDSPKLNKCAADNGLNSMPVTHAHNWFFTSFLYFGVTGVLALLALLLLSFRDSIKVWLLTPMAVAPLVFWVIGLTSVMLWSPFVLTHAAVVTFAINSLARQNSQDRTAA